MRVGVIILPQGRWNEDHARWRRADEYGFDHAWTYDHLSWRALVDEPWFATVPTLAAAALVTQRIRLGTLVASPNFRHPVPFAKELMSLDDLSEGRFILGVGAGGRGFDATVLGDAVPSPGERVTRLEEFVTMLDQLLTQPVTTVHGHLYSGVDARMIPGCTQRPRLPFVIAAIDRRSMRLAARFGQGWVTTGGASTDREEWWRTVGSLSRRFATSLADAGRPPDDVDRYLMLDRLRPSALTGDEFAESVERADDLGFTDVVFHWPRTSEPFAGDERLLDDVAAQRDPRAN
jgi:alkanesulfonate monooxygenase SsuD/methylene tetrahydromethanopterin reductase-like flavin-dependent oxidoreductase (luciferase family)